LARTYAELPRAIEEGAGIHARRELAQQTLSSEGPHAGVAARPASGEPSAGWQVLVDALAQLPADRRLALTLKVYDKLDDGAIARVLERAGEEFGGAGASHLGTRTNRRLLTGES
jgi:hypothetical protein